MAKPILTVEDLTMHYRTRGGEVSAVDHVSFTVNAGESLGLVGESGCGKTSIATTILRLLPDNAHIAGGHICLDGLDLTTLPDEDMRQVRWRRISMVFQAAMNSLNPVYRVGEQIVEAIQTHAPTTDNDEARAQVVKLFQLVGLDDKLLGRYPHEFSGGMRQRAVIAMALACNPDLIIADEPTTALDVIVQDSLLKEIRKFQRSLGMAMIYISHDMAVIAEVSERVGVMYAGRLAELSTTEDIFVRPIHPYTYALMCCFPSIRGEKRLLNTLPGEPPDLLHPPTGCRFHPRCANCHERCRQEAPPWRDFGGGHFAACWNPVEANQP